MAYSFYEKPIAEQRSVICHMGSHSVIRHRTQVNFSRLNLSHTGRYSISTPEGQKAELTLVLVIYRDGSPVRKQSVTHSVTNHLITKRSDRESNLRPRDRKFDISSSHNRKSSPLITDILRHCKGQRKPTLRYKIPSPSAHRRYGIYGRSNGCLQTPATDDDDDSDDDYKR